MKETALSSRPQETENSRQYLLLRTDIVKKTVVVCPLKFYISSLNLAKTHARPLTKIEKHIPYFCFCFLLSCIQETIQIGLFDSVTRRAFADTPRILYKRRSVIIIRKFRVMKRNLERVTHVEQKLIEISLILHQKVRTSMTSYSLLVSFFQICPQLGSMNFR